MLYIHNMLRRNHGQITHSKFVGNTHKNQSANWNITTDPMFIQYECWLTWVSTGRLCEYSSEFLGKASDFHDHISSISVSRMTFLKEIRLV